MKASESKVVAIIALVLGVLALLGSWLPILNNISFIIAIPALILGIVSLVINRNKKKTISVIATIFAVIAMGIVLMTQAMYSKALDEAGKAVDEAVEKVEKEQKEAQQKAEDNFKWTKADYDALVVGEDFSGVGGVNYDEVVAKYGEPSNKSESTAGDYTSLLVTYDNAGAENYKSVSLSFTKQEDGTFLLSSKNSFGIE